MRAAGERVKRHPHVFTNTSNLDSPKKGIAQIPVTSCSLFPLPQSQPRHFGRFPQNAEAIPNAPSRRGLGLTPAVSLKQATCDRPSAYDRS